MPDEPSLPEFVEVAEDDLAETPGDNEAQIAALVRAIKFQHGFGVYFVGIRQAEQRREFLADLRQRLPAFSVRDVFLREPETSLLNRLREELSSLPAKSSRPLLCIYGMENWLGGVEAVESSDIVGNMNATRNSLSTLDCPLLFCVPEHILTGIMRGAPDFFSVRSGLYFLDTPPDARFLPKATAIHSTELRVALDAGVEARQQQALEWEEILNGYRALPQDRRDQDAEATVLYNLATIRFANGDYDLAAQLLEKALRINEMKYGSVHAESAESMSRLAVLYERLGKYERAMELLERALSIQEAIIPNSLQMAGTLNNIGVVCAKNGDSEKALIFFKKVLSIFESVFGNNHPDISSIISNIAGIYEIKGEYARSLQLMIRAMSINQSSFGFDNPVVADNLYNLSLLNAKFGDYAQSLIYLERAVEIAMSKLGKDHPVTDNYLKALSYLQSDILMASQTTDLTTTSQHDWAGPLLGHQGRPITPITKRRKKK